MRTKRSIRWAVLGILMLSVSVLSLSTRSSAEIALGISVRIGPPALPVYAQPLCPGPGYLWTPGYWSWSDDGGYYWVPGTWVIAPVGMLWTPGYWGFAGGLYGWHPGYWGPHVGFYGGINYGFGYGGVGFAGGEWRGGAFFYNRAVLNVNVVNVRNVYTRTVVVNNVHTSFNGPGGIEARPTAQEEAYGRERHTEALSTQREQERAASQNRTLFASANHGRPEIAATSRPGEFSGRDVERSRAAGEPYREPKMSPQEARGRDSNVPSRNGESRNNEVRNNDEMRNNDAGKHDQMSSRENSNHNKPSKQERQAQKKADKQAKAEQKRDRSER
jgi:WXXGXW repeat (2 copies)